MICLRLFLAVMSSDGPPDASRYTLEFQDEFNGSSIDQSKWNYRLGPRMWSEQRPQNVSVSGGFLRLALRREKVDKLEYTAGGLISKRAFGYGYYEARIRMPRGRGWHTSFWMMRNGPTVGKEDRFQEIDVCEQDSVDPHGYSVNFHVYKPHGSFGFRRIKTPDLSADFHIYGAEYTSREVRFFLDGKFVHSIDVSSVPQFDQHIWLTSIASWLGGTKNVDDAALPEVALFDWVRYYRPRDQKVDRSKPMDLAKALQPTPDTAKFAEPGCYVWCGSAVRGDDGKYHLFYSRWPQRLGHNAWVTHSEIAHAVADSPFGAFRPVGVALPRRGAEYWDGLCTHNPTVLRAGDKYYLYYMGNTGDDKAMESLNWEHRNHQRIGVAVADSPNGPWKRFDHPLIDVDADPKAPDSLVTTNPSVARRPDGGFLMIYKAVGRQRPLPFGGPVVHLVATSDSPTGPFMKRSKPIFTAAGVDFPAEDPFVWYDWKSGRYRAIVKDNAGFFTHAGKSIAQWESKDGFDWRPSANPLLSTTEIRWKTGTTQKVNSLERPQLLFGTDGRPIALLCAVDEDAARTHSYNVRIPLGQP